jgi:hypothetical protein
MGLLGSDTGGVHVVTAVRASSLETYIREGRVTLVSGRRSLRATIYDDESRRHGEIGPQ